MTIKDEERNGNPSKPPVIQLPKKAIKEFQEKYLQEKGIALTDKEAEQLGVSLLRLYNLVYKPIPKIREEVSNDGTNSI